MTTQQTVFKVLTVIRRAILWVLIPIVVILATLIILLQTPFAQNYVTDQLLEYLNKHTRSTAKINNIDIMWFDFVEIEGFRLEDYKSKTMLKADRLIVDYDITSLLSTGGISLDKVRLENSTLHFKNYKDTAGLNIVEFIKDLNALVKKPKDTTRVIGITIDEVELNNFQFAFDNNNRDTMPRERFDYGHFLLKIPNMTVSDFLLHRDTIQGEVTSFAALDPRSGLQVKEMKTFFRLSNQGLLMDKLYLETAHSVLKDYLEFRYSGMNDLSYFVDSVQFDVVLDNSHINKKDIAYFADMSRVEDFDFVASGRVSGSVPNMDLMDMEIFFGKSSHFNGSVSFLGLPTLYETFINAEVEDALIYGEALEPFVPVKTLSQIKLMDPVSFKGSFLGFINDFVADGHFDTPLGSITSDINLKFPRDRKTASYSGSLTLDRFNVGKVIGRPDLVGTVNMTGKVAGSGLDSKTAKVSLNATLWDSQFKGYRYRAIRTKGQLQSQAFQGSLIVNDPNAKFSVNGKVDFKNSPEEIDIGAAIEHLNVTAIGFAKQPLILSGNVHSDITSLNVDEMEGHVTFTDFMLGLRGDTLQLDSIAISTNRYQDIRTASLVMPELEATIEGDFVASHLYEDVSVISKEVLAYFDPREDNKITRDSSYTDRSGYALDLELEYGDLSGYARVLDSELYISPNGKVKGSFFLRKNATLSLYSDIDSIYYKSIGFKGNSVDISFSKDLDSTAILASVIVQSNQQVYKRLANTSDLLMEAVWYGNDLDFVFNVDQPKNQSELDLNGHLQFMGDSLKFSLLPSNIVAYGEKWYIDPSNSVVYTRDGTRVDEMGFYKNAQSILISGVYSDSLESDIDVKVTDFDMHALSSMVPADFEGVLNGSLKLQRADEEEGFLMDGEIEVDNLSINSFPIGEVRAEVDWQAIQEALAVQLDVFREGANTISVSGYYSPYKKENNLDIKAQLRNANIHFLDPLIGHLVSGTTGFANGNFQIGGKLSYPIVTGKVNISEGRFKIDYLGVTYRFEGDALFKENAINLTAFRLYDSNNNRAFLTGDIFHRGFSSFRTNIDIAANNFQFLNTNATQNKLYYGSVYGSGDISITGSFNDILITADAETAAGTKFYIPLSGDDAISQKNYITFVDLSDTTRNVNVSKVIQQDLAGVTLDFAIDVTTDAYVELIFNIRTGDIIRGRGTGSLKMELDTHGEFELFGDLTISEGGYNFTIPNLISKEFSISPGGTISWYGDPYAGVLNLNATYRQLASFDDYRPQTTDAAATRYPMLVVLDLRGNMLSPDINFAIRMDDDQLSPTSFAQAILNEINNDEQRLRRQVFSLLILRKFSPQSSIDVGGEAVGSSLSEFLANQFSYLVSQVDENLEIDVDLASLDQNEFNILQLRLSYTFLNGRLRVSGGGGWLSQTATDETVSTTTGYLGDWAIRYLLTPDGHLRIRAFSQSDQISNQLQRENRENGVSLQYLKSFDTFKELMSRSRENAIQSTPKDVQAKQQ